LRKVIIAGGKPSTFNIQYRISKGDGARDYFDVER
jgi:hypothetical protein